MQKQLLTFAKIGITILQEFFFFNERPSVSLIFNHCVKMTGCAGSLFPNFVQTLHILAVWRCCYELLHQPLSQLSWCMCLFVWPYHALTLLQLQDLVLSLFIEYCRWLHTIFTLRLRFFSYLRLVNGVWGRVTFSKVRLLLVLPFGCHHLAPLWYHPFTLVCMTYRCHCCRAWWRGSMGWCLSHSWCTGWCHPCRGDGRWLHYFGTGIHICP